MLSGRAIGVKGRPAAVTLAERGVDQEAVPELRSQGIGSMAL